MPIRETLIVPMAIAMKLRPRVRPRASAIGPGTWFRARGRDAAASRSRPRRHRGAPMAARRARSRTPAAVRRESPESRATSPSRESLRAVTSRYDIVRIARHDVFERHRRRRCRHVCVDVRAAGDVEELTQEAATTDRDDRLIPRGMNTVGMRQRCRARANALERRAHRIYDRVGLRRVAGDPPEQPRVAPNCSMLSSLNATVGMPA